MLTKKQGFQFKQFFVAHDRCAMKVNTDGILLGAIADVKNRQHILDLGTGSGLIALMLAQRSAPDCQITALEWEENAYQQAVENAQFSAWRERIQVLHGDVLQVDFNTTFDLIVSNPPYFTDNLATRNHARDLARSATQSHLSWLEAGAKWLSDSGNICFILPYEAGEKLIAQALLLEQPLYCVERWAISTKSGQPPKRIMVNFSPKMTACTERTLNIYEQNQQYSTDFMALTQAFYLNM